MLKAQLEIITSFTPQPPEGFMSVNAPISFHNDSVFGREQADVDYAIADDYVSRKHFQIAFMGDEAYLTDLNSRHGTFLNGDRINKSIRLHSGDTIRVGKTTLTIQLDLNQKSNKNRPALASYDQPAIMSIDGESSSRVFFHADSHAEHSSSLQDHPTDLEIPLMAESPPAKGEENRRKNRDDQVRAESPTGRDREVKEKSEPLPVHPIVAASEVLPVDESGLDVHRPDSQPQYELDPTDHPLFPDIISADSVSDFDGNAQDDEVDGPVFIDDFDVGMLPLVKPTSAPQEVLENEPLVEKIEKAYAQPSGDSPAASLSKLQSAEWQSLASGWFEYPWCAPRSAESLCEAFDEVGQNVSLWSVVQFAKIGSSTPWSLADCQAIWQGIPEPLAKTYGPVVTHYSSLRKALKPEAISKLWQADALLMLGGNNATVMQKGLRERTWFGPVKGTVGFKEYPIYSSSFWHLWAHQNGPTAFETAPPWSEHISVVLIGGRSNTSEIRVLSRRQISLRDIS